MRLILHENLALGSSNSGFFNDILRYIAKPHKDVGFRCPTGLLKYASLCGLGI